MPIRTISTVIHDFDVQSDTLDLAISVARAQDAHLSVFVLGVDETEPGFYYAGAQEVIVGANFDAAQKHESEQQEAARTRLQNSEIKWDVAGLILQHGILATTLGDRLRYSDLVVVSAPYAQKRSRVAETVAEAALFNASLPCLIVPPDYPTKMPETAFRRILVAWNDGDQALAAVRAAYPFIATADLVDISVIDPSTSGPDRSDPGGRLAQVVTRHGARAEVTVLAKGEQPVADQLSQRARETGADLIVMGAYGHSRMREAIFGGATRRMFETLQVPVLMAH
jgi:nucleotide-binding universal stress UspA family protein